MAASLSQDNSLYGDALAVLTQQAVVSDYVEKERSNESTRHEVEPADLSPWYFLRREAKSIAISAVTALLVVGLVELLVLRSGFFGDHTSLSDSDSPAVRTQPESMGAT
jgi:hypothetical protein